MTILLAWNPKHFSWGDLEDELAQCRARGSSDNGWTIGNRRSVDIGTRFFLIRLGSEPRGITASGHTVSSPYQAEHWDPDRAKCGAEARYVDIVFDYLSEIPVVSYQELSRPPLDKCHWSTQMSGIQIPDEVAMHLEGIWKERTASFAVGRPEEYESAVALREGAAIQVYVNRYERNREARTICLGRYGKVCAVCEKRMSDIYAGISDDLIHVHHLVPISDIKKTYQINPLVDLRPVCPNCHAVLHSESPPLSVPAARARLKATSR
jgi:5-methylcytosine-specific restriction protein A